MSDELSPEAAEAIHKATSAAQAVEISREVQINNAIARHEETIFNALNDNYTSIMTTLATLIAGQNATNEHFVRLNGTVAEHQKEIATLKLWKAEARGFIGAINIGWSALLTLLSGGLATFFWWLFNK